MYDIVITDRSHVPQGHVLGASEFQFFRGLGKLSTVSFKVGLDNVHEERLASLDGFIKVYRSGTLAYVGPIISSEETADREARSVAITSADVGWNLSKRVAGRSATGTLWTTATPRHTIAKALVDAANADAETGVDTSFYTYSSGSSITHKVQYANLLASIQDLGSALDGFDWLIRPRENWVNGALSTAKIGRLQIASVIGTTQPNAVFEYGMDTRSNVVTYTLSRTRDQQANVVYHVGSNPADVKTGTNAAALAAWGRMADVVSGEFTDAGFRQSLVDEHVNVRGNPRVLIRFTPHIDPGELGRVPQPFVDYDVGDTVTFRAVHSGRVRFAGLVRVYGIRITIDPAGFERVELVVEDE